MNSIGERYQRSIAESQEYLSIQAEVGMIVENMLDDIEVWYWVNEVHDLEYQLAENINTIQKMKEEASIALTRENALKEKIEQDRIKARELKDVLAAQLWTLAKYFITKHEEEEKYHEVALIAAKVPQLENELNSLKTELTPAKISLGSKVASTLLSVNSINLINEETRISNRFGRAHDFLNFPPQILVRLFSFLDSADVAYAVAASKMQLATVETFLDSENASVVKSERSSSPEPFLLTQNVQTSARNSNSFNSITTNLIQNGVKTLTRQNLSGGMVSLLSAVVGQRNQVDANLSPNPSSTTSAFLSPSSNQLEASRSLAEKDSSAFGNDVITALSKKLNTTEMRGIIALTERLSKMQSLVRKLQGEKEDLLMQKIAIEKVKDFLSDKFNEAEQVLAEERVKISNMQQQISSDAEVISYLDARTQELEKVSSESIDKALQAQLLLEEVRADSHRSLKNQQDLLQFEKEKGESEASNLRQARKVLIAEVKKLRQENSELMRSLSQSSNSGSRR